MTITINDLEEIYSSPFEVTSTDFSKVTVDNFKGEFQENFY